MFLRRKGFFTQICLCVIFICILNYFNVYEISPSSLLLLPVEKSYKGGEESFESLLSDLKLFDSLPDIDTNEQDLNVQASASNRTSADGSILVYNRVYKTGSTAFLGVLRRLGKMHNYKLESCTIRNDTRLNNEAQTKLVNKWLQHFYDNGVFSYERHFDFIDISSIHGPTDQEQQLFVWMNFIRDPIDRFVSNFYYQRRPSIDGRPGVVEQSILKGWPTPSEEWLKKTLEDCVPKQDPECLYPNGQTGGDLQLAFFCGQDPRCRTIGSRWALERAKYNVENYFSVVGIIEQDALSLRVLENYVPKFFNGLSKIERGTANTNPSKPNVSDATLAMLRENSFKEDVEFYDFVKERLFIQAKHLNIYNEYIL